MTFTDALGLLGVVVLVLANGFFVATEFAIVAVRRSRLEQLAAEGHPTASAARDLVGHLDAYIAACQLGITMASLALGWIGEPALAHLIEPPLEAFVGTFAPTAAHGVAIGIAFAIITALHIIIGELAPKGLALQRPEGTALYVARPMQIFYVLFRWPITFLNTIGNGVLKLAGLEPASGHEMVHTVEEMRLLVQSMQAAGTVEASEARIASRAFVFADLTAGSLMTPRTELEAVPITASMKELLDCARRGVHNRLLVYDESLDHIVGILHVRDLLTALDQPVESFDIRALLRSVLTVPDTKAADDLLEEMRAARRQLAVVIDEYGGTAGIVTLEDLAEALIGRIEEEPPIGGEMATFTSVLVESEDQLVLAGLTRLDEFEEMTGLKLAPEIHEAVDTIGGMIMTQLGRVPAVGDEIRVDGYTMRVEELDGRRVATIRLIPHRGDGGDEGGEEE